MRALRWLGFVMVLTGGTVLAGCSQGAGDPCKEDEDCEGSLICCILSGDRGTCRTPTECDMLMQQEDAGQDPADAGTDAAVDAAADAAADGGADAAADAGVDAGSDAGPADAT